MTDPTPTRVKLVLDEVLDGRVGPTRTGVRAYVDEMYQGLIEIERTTVVSAVMKEINSWPKQEKRKPMSKPKKVLRGKKIVPVAARYYRANPELTAQECHQAMLRDGHRIEMKVSSFEGSGYAREAKKLAESDAELDAPPSATEPEPDPEPEPVAVTRASNGLPVDTSDGDYVRFSLGGQKLDAQREGEEWDVAFEGTVGDGMVRELLGRVFGGSS